MTALGSVPHVIVADVQAPELTDEDRHHLTRVLRLRDGDEVTVTDGDGRWRVCRVGDHIEPVSEVVSVERLTPALTVAFARTKGDRPELAVQKLTELGVDRIVVFEAERSVARWDPERVPRQLERLARVAREASMQSRRLHLPAVEVAPDFGAVAGTAGAAMADFDGGAPSLAQPTVLIGPEGGWSDDERRHALPRVRLSAQVLRAETAAITAGVMLATLRSGLVQAGHDGGEDGDGMRTFPTQSEDVGRSSE